MNNKGFCLGDAFLKFLSIFVQVYSKSIEHFIGVFSAVDTTFLCIIDVRWCILNSMTLSILGSLYMYICAKLFCLAIAWSAT